MRILYVLLICIFTSPPLLSNQASLVVSAASSLKDSFAELGKQFEEKHQIKVLFNFAGSGILRSQIELGAPVDVFASASSSDMDILENKKMINPESRFDFTSNEMVLVKKIDSKIKILTIQNLLNPHVKRLSMGNPKTVPAGKYALKILTEAKLAEKLKEKIIYTESVRQTLDYILLGEVDAGFVFASDVFNNSKIRTVSKFTLKDHGPINYPIAIVKESKKKTDAFKFVQFVKEYSKKHYFHRFGFK